MGVAILGHYQNVSTTSSASSPLIKSGSGAISYINWEQIHTITTTTAKRFAIVYYYGNCNGGQTYALAAGFFKSGEDVHFSNILVTTEGPHYIVWHSDGRLSIHQTYDAEGNCSYKAMIV